MEWMRSMGLSERCGMLLEHTPHGVSATEAEETYWDAGVQLDRECRADSATGDLARIKHGRGR